MPTMIEAPISMIEAVADLHLPPKADQRMQELMDRNNNGALTPEEREQLETLVELSETIAIVRAQALHLLKRAPRCAIVSQCLSFLFTLALWKKPFPDGS